MFICDASQKESEETRIKGKSVREPQTLEDEGVGEGKAIVLTKEVGDGVKKRLGMKEELRKIVGTDISLVMGTE